MKKKLVSLLLVAALALSLGGVSFAASYSDLEGHWSRDYMVDLANRGYLTGYEDNTMRPENNITVCESLVFLSRFYSLDKETKQAIYEEYGDLVEKTTASSLSWAYESLAICLAAGIITEAEFKSVSLGRAIEKEVLAVFLVRAMQLEDSAEALTGSELNFSDTAQISSAYRGHVVVLVMADVVQGDENNNFSPKLSVTRAVVATMVSRALDYIEKWDLKLEIKDFDGLFKSGGVISSVSASTFRICGQDGLTREYTLGTDAKITVNGEATSLTSSYVGCYADVKENNGVVTSVSIDEEDDIEWVQGALSSVSSGTSSSSARYIYISNPATGARKQYTVLSEASIYQGGESVAFSKLTRSNFVTAKLENGKIIELYSYSGEADVKGTVSSLNVGSTVVLKLKDSSGRIWVFQMDILDMPATYRGDVEISVDRLNVGDEVVLKVKNGAVREISTTAQEASIKGELTSIVTTSAGTSWVILTEGGESVTYTLDSSARAYSGSKSIAVSSIGIGDIVSLVVYANIITEVTLESPYSATTKLSATVLAVDVSTLEITALVSGKLVYIDCSGLSYIINASTGGSVKLSSIDADDTIAVYGSYKTATSFAATSIIIES